MAKKIVLKVENLSKQYRLGLVGTGTLSHDLNRWWHRIRGKEDPYLKLGETNDRASKGNSDYVWALKDIDFEVEQGEVLGIIGKNGAGKSTLLKILSKVTGPSKGFIKAKGRIASLLEVGTGFHPELTGRENIFLNGAILGMTRAEIKSKIDEIVDFAGIERYADTPVKRYSSGMYVRLAFAVAAHLESEILIVDEVLAVGDVDFQKKAIGKMKSVSQGEGRTVLFVSHDLVAVKSLCTRGILLKDGMIYKSGSVDSIINEYTKTTASELSKDEDLQLIKRNGNCIREIELKKIELNQILFSSNSKLEISLTLSSSIDFDAFTLAIAINDLNGNTVFHIGNNLLPEAEQAINKGDSIFKFTIPKLRLRKGFYTITAFVSTPGVIQDWIENAINFEVEESNIYSNKERFILHGIYQTDFNFTSCN